MGLIIALKFLLPYLLYHAQCIDITNEAEDDVGFDRLHRAEVDMDLGVDYHLGQKDLPQEWQRELMALTALSRVQEAGLLAPDSLHEHSAWRRFRGNGVYEALLNMAKITGFQMHNGDYPKGWSMWGLQHSVLTYKMKHILTKVDPYWFFRHEVAKYPFDPNATSWLAQSSMAFLMSAKWAVDLKKLDTTYSKPFYTISETAEALAKLKDPTGYFVGNQADFERRLREKTIDANPRSCQRELRISIAFDTFWYSDQDMNLLNGLLDEINRFAPLANITIRGTSKLPGGFAEGSRMDRYPRMSAKPNDKSFQILDLVEKSIGDIADSRDGSRLKGRVLLIISRFKDRHVNIRRAQQLSKRMKELWVEPFYFTVEGQEVPYEDGDLMPLLNDETFRGISSGSSEITAMRLAMYRLVRLICQSPVPVPEDVFKIVEMFDTPPTTTINRIHLRFAPKESIPRRLLQFKCFSKECSFHVYGHAQRHVCEFFYDSHLAVQLSNAKNISSDFSSSRSGKSAENLVVVPLKAGLVGLRHRPSYPTDRSSEFGVVTSDLTFV